MLKSSNCWNLQTLSNQLHEPNLLAPFDTWWFVPVKDTCLKNMSMWTIQKIFFLRIQSQIIIFSSYTYTPGFSQGSSLLKAHEANVNLIQIEEITKYLRNITHNNILWTFLERCLSKVIHVHTMKSYGTVEPQLHAFLTSVFDGGQ